MMSSPPLPSPRACVSLLLCPVCGDQLADCGPSARCDSGHSFDFARAGYLSLAPNTRRRRIGDSSEMVAARESFLERGHLARVAELIADSALEAGAAHRTIVELGSGTAYYLGAVRDRLPADPDRCLIGVDLSKDAARAGSRRLRDALFVVADVERQIPMASARVDLLLSVFAPRPSAEIGRVLKPGGALVLAFAAPDHIATVRERFDLLDIHPHKLEQIAAQADGTLSLQNVRRAAYEVTLSGEDVRLLVAMGPNARRTTLPATRPQPVRTRASVVVARFTRR